MIRIVIADDSATVRGVLRNLLERAGDLRIVGEARDGDEVVKLVAELRPDVVTMDIIMPKRDGFEATKEIMITCPTPIVIVSALEALDDAEASARALGAGALAVVKRPGLDGSSSEVETLQSTVRAMAGVRVITRRRNVVRVPVACRTAGEIVGIAASTGGPAALRAIFAPLPLEFPAPILVVQHLGTGFLDGLVRWLESITALRVKAAEDGERLQPGWIYLAPDNRHLTVTHGSRVSLEDSPAIQGFRPAATALFRSLSQFGASAIGVVLTGMGSDGVPGLLAMHDAGAHVIAQDEATSVVWGMPGAALAAGAVSEELPLHEIGSCLQARVRAEETQTEGPQR